MKPMTHKPSKMTDKWWKTYRAIFKALFHREPDRAEFSDIAARCTDAAFETLGINKYVQTDL